jgi:hypothetical protein
VQTSVFLSINKTKEPKHWSHVKKAQKIFQLTFFPFVKNPPNDLQMRSCTGSIAVQNNREPLIMCLAVRVPKIRMFENKGKPLRNRIIARCREAESYVRLWYARNRKCRIKKCVGVGIIAKKDIKKQKGVFLRLDEEGGETSNTGKGHTGVELASSTSVG